MRILILIICYLLLINSTAFAQQKVVDPNRAINAFQIQRNTALNEAALSQAYIEELIEKLAKTEARIKELENKLENRDKKE